MQNSVYSLTESSYMYSRIHKYLPKDKKQQPEALWLYIPELQGGS